MTAYMISGTISASNYLDAQRLHRRKALRLCYLASAMLVVLGAGACLAAEWQIGLALVAGGCCGALAELGMDRFYLPRKVSRIHRQQKDFTVPYTYAWDADFIEITGTNAYWKREWKNYAKFREDDTLFLLYHADNLFEVFPKKWFRDDAQIAAFRQVAAQAGT